MTEAMIFLKKGINYLKQGIIDKAEEEFSKAVQIDPNLGIENEMIENLDYNIKSNVRNMLAEAHYLEYQAYIIMKEEIKPEELEKKVKNCETALYLGLQADKEIAAHAFLASDYGYLNRKSDLISHIEKAISLDSKRGFNFFNENPLIPTLLIKLDLAYCIEAQSIEKELGIDVAITYLKEKLKLVSTVPHALMPRVLLELGNLYLKKSNNDLASILFKKVIKCKDKIYSEKFDEIILEIIEKDIEEAKRNLKMIEGKREKNKCFIATAVYQNPHHPEVQMLVNFRDNFLMQNNLGRLFVFFYYRVSPFISSAIIKSKLAKHFTKLIILKPIIWFVRWYSYSHKTSNGI